MKRSHVDRRSKRYRLNLSVLLRDATGGRTKAHLFNISAHGCALLADTNCLREGRIYSLQIEGLETLLGRAVWTRNLWAGLEFTCALHPAVAEHLALRGGAIPDYGADDLLNEMVKLETSHWRRPFDPP
jgi:hypothetical protein